MKLRALIEPGEANHAAVKALFESDCARFVREGRFARYASRFETSVLNAPRKAVVVVSLTPIAYTLAWTVVRRPKGFARLAPAERLARALKMEVLARLYVGFGDLIPVVIARPSCCEGKSA